MADTSRNSHPTRVNSRSFYVTVWPAVGIGGCSTGPPSRSRSSGGGSSSIRYSNSLRKSSSDRPARRGELGELVRILEVVAAQPDHVAARDRVARGVDVDQAHARAARLASIISLNGIGTKWPPCIEIMAALPPASRYLAAQ